MRGKKAKQARRVCFNPTPFHAPRKYASVNIHTREYLVTLKNGAVRPRKLDEQVSITATVATLILKPGTPHSNYRRLKAALREGARQGLRRFRGA